MCVGERRTCERTTLDRIIYTGKHLVRVDKKQGDKILQDLKENRKGNKDKEKS